MKTAIGFKLIGSSYSSKGQFRQGWTIITLDNGMEEWFNQSVSLTEAIRICRARGIATQVLEDELEQWVKTGKWES